MLLSFLAGLVLLLLGMVTGLMANWRTKRKMPQLSRRSKLVLGRVQTEQNMFLCWHDGELEDNYDRNNPQQLRSDRLSYVTPRSYHQIRRTCCLTCISFTYRSFQPYLSYTVDGQHALDAAIHISCFTFLQSVFLYGQLFCCIFFHLFKLKMKVVLLFLV